MNYNEIKKNYDIARREQLNADKELTRIAKELVLNRHLSTQCMSWWHSMKLLRASCFNHHSTEVKS